LVEAKKADIKSGLGQCAAEMVAAQKFNAGSMRFCVKPNRHDFGHSKKPQSGGF
jgi:hypothetical protein